ncbi:PadR family transcriptional regulator [Kocuria coralli]|uniref:PadR family transcriptional regulator n=1 Tax=Kocuria coralli TaxID=1461025 RepID=A0A5J5KX29_9MICC|nr:PadR family transcriptional regulator [Kocuria coralli]KAA9394194.1 PadR family transcriptional regulator [Kocuria coralli]
MHERAPKSEWLRGVLEMCVLQTMVDEPTYGYAITTRLARAGFGELKGGTLYPLLARLEKKGLVSVEWRAGEGGPGRKYFALTHDGRLELETARRQWGDFVGIVSDHVGQAERTRSTQEVSP